VGDDTIGNTTECDGAPVECRALLIGPGTTRNKFHACCNGVGCGILSKVSGLILIPFFIVLLIFFCFYESKVRPGSVMAYVPGFLSLIGVAMLTVSSFYLVELSQDYVGFAYPEVGSSVVGRFTIPFREYFRHIEAVYRWVAQPYNKPQFLLGSFSFSGWWYYYPVAFALKTPVTFLLLTVLAVCGLAYLAKTVKAYSEEEKKSFFFLLGSFFFVFLFFIVSCRSNLDIGIRYILPVYPFLAVFIAISFFLLRSHLKRSRQFLSAVLIACTLGSAVTGIMSFPHYLGYFNPFIGADENADRYLIDSNLDWGQDLKRLGIWTEQNGIAAIRVVYFGGGDVNYYLGRRVIWGSEMDLLADFFSGVPGYYAISRHIFRSSSFFLN